MTTSVRHARAFLPLAIAGVLGLAACSSSGGQGSSSTTASAGGAATTVQIRSSAVGDVLTDRDGRTLYTSDQEHRQVLCRSAACTAIWVPLTVAAGAQPSAPSGLAAPLGVITRPGGRAQVTLGGQPLYRFSFDRRAGQAGGDRQADSFDGTSFTWHAALVGARRAAASTPASGGYHY